MTNEMPLDVVPGMSTAPQAAPPAGAGVLTRAALRSAAWLLRLAAEDERLPPWHRQCLRLYATCAQDGVLRAARRAVADARAGLSA